MIRSTHRAVDVRTDAERCEDRKQRAFRKSFIMGTPLSEIGDTDAVVEAFLHGAKMDMEEVVPRQPVPSGRRDVTFTWRSDNGVRWKVPVAYGVGG